MDQFTSCTSINFAQAIWPISLRSSVPRFDLGGDFWFSGGCKEVNVEQYGLGELSTASNVFKIGVFYCRLRFSRVMLTLTMRHILGMTLQSHSNLKISSSLSWFIYGRNPKQTMFIKILVLTGPTRVRELRNLVPGVHKVSDCSIIQSHIISDREYN